VTDHVYVQNMKVKQARHHLGDPRWYVVNAADHIVKGPYDSRPIADFKLFEIRRKAREEGDPED